MMRFILILCAFAMAAAGAVRLTGETRYLLRGSDAVGEILSASGREEVVFVFQPEDCLSNGALLGRWNELHRSGRLGVRGLVAGAGPSTLQQDLFAKRDLDLPLGTISVRDAAIVAERLGYTSTPFAVILDRQGRVAGAFPAQQNVPPEMLQAIARGD